MFRAWSYGRGALAAAGCTSAAALSLCSTPLEPSSSTADNSAANSIPPRPGLKLLQVQTAFRHGARTPLYSLSEDVRWSRAEYAMPKAGLCEIECYRSFSSLQTSRQDQLVRVGFYVALFAAHLTVSRNAEAEAVASGQGSEQCLSNSEPSGHARRNQYILRRSSLPRCSKNTILLTAHCRAALCQASSRPRADARRSSWAPRCALAMWARATADCCRTRGSGPVGW